ncbi:KH domain-containing protein [bacterium]|nr:KH domain-containing protein [bacterium]
MEDKDLIKLTEEQVEKLCSLMGVDCDRTVTVEDSDNGEIKYIKVTFQGEELGYMIGSHGRNLDSIQYILQIILRKLIADKCDFRVFVDVSGYRQEKNEKLEQLALRKAEDARLLGEEVELAPMKPSDRRVVHLALMNFDDIETESRGEGRDRHIVIKLKK